MEPVQPPDAQAVADAAAGRSAESNEVGPLAADLANSLMRALEVAIRDLQKQKSAEITALSDSVRQHREKLDATISLLTDLRDRIEHLTAAVSEEKSVGRAAQERCEQLAVAVVALQEADARHDSALAALSRSAEELSESFSGRLDALAGQVQSQGEEVAGVKSAVSEISSSVAALSARLDRQAEAIRSLCEAQNQREAALRQLFENLGRLRVLMAPPDSTPEVPL
jgi:chromosome segregation ATPase